MENIFKGLYMLDIIYQIVNFFSSLLSGVAASIAIYLFITKRKTITSFFNSLLNYSIQISLTELRNKLDILNSLDADDDEQKTEVINILNDIKGQIRGNPVLNKKCNIDIISKYADNPINLTNPLKRGIVSELRENLRIIEFQQYSEIIGHKYE